MARLSCFEQDEQFLREYVDTITLTDAAGEARIVVVPAWQGRVMTSTTGGAQGPSFGWINRPFIAQRRVVPHMNPYGGEERFWLGPEGGQFSLYFAGGVPYDLEHWQVPAVIDTEPFEVVSASGREIGFTRETSLVNRSGTRFDLSIRRVVRMLERDGAAALFGCPIPADLSIVAYETENTVTNAGEHAWDHEGGMIAVWILGMFPPSQHTTIVMPYRQGDEAQLGPAVNDDYFGRIPGDRLKTGDGVVYLRADGCHRGKIGLSARRALPVAGAWDAEAGVLTLIHFTFNESATEYVNSAWADQDQPFAGDVSNAYNDGGAASGDEAAGFFELESSSPALRLAPCASHTHAHRTVHLQGPREDLDAVARGVLGVGLDQIERQFPAGRQ